MNIAIYLLDKAHRDEYDEALLLTADTDLNPSHQNGQGQVQSQIDHRRSSAW